jgi:hypothetical protein
VFDNHALIIFEGELRVWGNCYDRDLILFRTVTPEETISAWSASRLGGHELNCFDLACSNPISSKALASGFLYSQSSLSGMTASNSSLISVSPIFSKMQVLLENSLPILIRPRELKKCFQVITRQAS